MSSWIADGIISSMARTLLVIVIIALVIGGAVAWRVYEYRDCIRVGHSTWYCIVNR